jgi:hypothetical protein
MPSKLKELQCKHVSASEAGDYFQVMFENTRDAEGGYLLVQRQFEMPDEGECYVEADDPEFGGHYRIRNARLTSEQFEFEFGNEPACKVGVFFEARGSTYSEVKRILQIMIPNLEFA